MLEFSVELSVSVRRLCLADEAVVLSAWPPLFSWAYDPFFLLPSGGSRGFHHQLQWYKSFSHVPMSCLESSWLHSSGRPTFLLQPDYNITIVDVYWICDNPSWFIQVIRTKQSILCCFKEITGGEASQWKDFVKFNADDGRFDFVLGVRCSRLAVVDAF